MKNKYFPLIALVTAGIPVLNIPDSSTNVYNKNNYSLEQVLNQTQSRIDTNINKFYSEYSSKEELKKFDRWIDSTLKESENKNTNSIIVNKLKKELYLIKDGEVHSEYPLDLGFNPIDDKKFEGDGCTPEGMYTVQRKLPTGTTSFYKAFLINYPNKEDKAMGKTGSLIEIHGRGGLGFNWTLGCMALSDEDMDKIFTYINEGNKVTIVRETTRNLSNKK